MSLNLLNILNIVNSFQFMTLVRHPERNVAIAKYSEGTSIYVFWTLPSSEGQYSRKSINVYYNSTDEKLGSYPPLVL